MGALNVGIVIHFDTARRRLQREGFRHRVQQLALGAVLGHAAAQLFARIGQRAVHDVVLFAALRLGDFHLEAGA